jgi:hypothetical protein
MNKKFTIPELLSVAGIRGYSPRLSDAINSLATTDSQLEYTKALEVATAEISGYTNVESYSPESANLGYNSQNHFEGLPIYLPLVLEPLKPNGNELVLESAIVEINRTKNIVSTVVQGRDTSVKEFINNGDFNITVSGLICNKGAGYPKQKVKQLEGYLSAKTSIKITHELMNLLGVGEIVITDYSLPYTPFMNMQAYSFNAMSDDPIELTISETL